MQCCGVQVRLSVLGGRGGSDLPGLPGGVWWFTPPRQGSLVVAFIPLVTCGAGGLGRRLLVRRASSSSGSCYPPCCSGAIPGRQVRAGGLVEPFLRSCRGVVCCGRVTCWVCAITVPACMAAMVPPLARRGAAAPRAPCFSRCPCFTGLPACWPGSGLRGARVWRLAGHLRLQGVRVRADRWKSPSDEPCNVGVRAVVLCGRVLVPAPRPLVRDWWGGGGGGGGGTCTSSTGHGLWGGFVPSALAVGSWARILLSSDTTPLPCLSQEVVGLGWWTSDATGCPARTT